MIIPKQVKIGGSIYQVNITKKTILINGRACYARIDYDNHQIDVNKKYGDEQQRQMSFLHEVFHGIVHDRNIKLKDEEKVVEAFARGLHQIIMDNPEIFIQEVKNESDSREHRTEEEHS